MSQKYISRLLRYNLTERKTLQSYKLNCFIWTASNVLNKENLLKAAQYLLLTNLIKPTTVCISPAHHWHNLTAVSKVPWNEQSSTVTLSRYSFQNSRYSNNNNYSYYYTSESSLHSRKENTYKLCCFCGNHSWGFYGPFPRGLIVMPSDFRCWAPFWTGWLAGWLAMWHQ